MMSDCKEKVRAAMSIADIAAKWYRITLNNRGRGVCPFCKYEKDKTTFWVSDNGQGFRCHHCGKRGDLFTLVMEMDNLDFPTALKKLADYAGIEWKTTPAQAGKTRKAKDKEAALQCFAKHWNNNLQNVITEDNTPVNTGAISTAKLDI